MPIFDPETFINQVSTAAGSTEYALPPEGEFQMMTGDGPVSKWFRTGTSEKGPWIRFEPLLLVLDDKVRAEMKRETVVVRYDGGFITLDDKTGDISTAKGDNVRYHQLRAALDQNVAGIPASALANAGPFLGRIRHETGSDGVTRASVNRVTKL